MKNVIKIFIWSCIIFIVSCSDGRKGINRIGSKEYTMELLPYKTFLLDANTTQTTNYIQVLNINDTARFTMFNPAKYNILIYDIATGNVIYDIHLCKDGPNNVGTNIQGYYLTTLDSIYLYDYWHNTFILVNREGIIIDKINISDKLLQPTENCVIPPSPYPRSDAPILKVKDNFILQGMCRKPPRECTTPQCMVTVLFNIKNDSILFANPYPDVYGNHKDIVDSWGEFSYKLAFYDINDRDEMTVSFPADDRIYVYDISSGNLKIFFSGYSSKDRISRRNNSAIGDLLHYLEQTQYAGVFFDKYRNLYYRLVVHPLYNYDVNDRYTWSKKLSVIILDSHFNKVGEYDLEEVTGQYSKTFVSEEGLHINVESEDDDYLKFISLKPVKL